MHNDMTDPVTGPPSLEIQILDPLRDRDAQPAS
jgi:hypothetical protein